MQEQLWCEKYRPKTIDDCILPPELKKLFGGIVKKGEMPNLMLAGTAGLGKTTVAKALCTQLGLDHILINGSEENGIDVLRNKIKQFASSVSLAGSVKVVILDEAEYLTTSCQTALRGFIEEFSGNCRFILTCNFKNRIIEPLHSRCSVIEFNTNKKSLAKLAMSFLTRLKFILDAESVKYDEQTIAELIIRHAPDWRRILGECQRYGMDGEIPSAVLTGNDASIDELMTHLKGKDFKSMRAWVANNASHDSTSIYRQLYDGLSESAQSASVPAAVMILADYSYKSAFSADVELITAACFTELMMNIEWK